MRDELLQVIQLCSENSSGSYKLLLQASKTWIWWDLGDEPWNSSETNCRYIKQLTFTWGLANLSISRQNETAQLQPWRVNWDCSRRKGHQRSWKKNFVYLSTRKDQDKKCIYMSKYLLWCRAQASEAIHLFVQNLDRSMIMHQWKSYT